MVERPDPVRRTPIAGGASRWEAFLIGLVGAAPILYACIHGLR